MEDNIVGIKVITPEATCRRIMENKWLCLTGQRVLDLSLKATIKIDKSEDDKMILVSFSTFEQLSAALQDLSKLKLPLPGRVLTR